jgi:hypothetical protein
VLSLLEGEPQGLVQDGLTVLMRLQGNLFGALLPAHCLTLGVLAPPAPQLLLALLKGMSGLLLQSVQQDHHCALHMALVQGHLADPMLPAH